MNIIRFPSIFIVVFIAILSIACSKSDSPIMPSNDATLDPSQGLPMSTLAGNSDRNLLAVYDAVIDPVAKTFTVTPDNRSVQYHFPLTQMFPNTLQVTGYGWTPNFWADIKINHPLPGSGIDAFDPRVIAILPARAGVSADYPELNMHANNSVVLEPDGYTSLHDSLGGSIPGNANPFKAYFKSVNNRRWSSTGTTEETQRWQMNLNGFGGSLQFKLVVDVSTNYPNQPQPIVDNTVEPFRFEVSLGEGLTNEGGEADITVSCFDWQGRMTVGGVYVESPDLFDNIINLAYYGPGPAQYEYLFKGTISNANIATAGEHKYLIAASDEATGTYLYNEYTLYVSEVSYQGNLIWAKSASGPEDDVGNAITTLSDDSFVVTGEYQDSVIFGRNEPNETHLISPSVTPEIFVARFNADGTLIWVRSAYGEGLFESGKDVTSLSDNSVVVTGAIDGTTVFGKGETNETVLWSKGDNDVFIARYNPDGTLAWAKSAGEPSGDRGRGITSLSDDSTIITGTCYNSIIFGEGESNETILPAAESFLARYNPDGTLEWAIGTDVASGYALCALSDDSVVVTGRTEYSNKFIIARYRADSTFWWLKSAGNSAGGMCVTALSDDSTVVTGYFRGLITFGYGEGHPTTFDAGEYQDIFITKYNRGGSYAWAKRADGVDYRNHSYSISSFPDDSTIITGSFFSTITFGSGEINECELTSFGDGDIFVARYNTDGSLNWVKQAEGADYWDRGYGIACLSDDTSVVTGGFYDTCTFGPGEENETILGGAGRNDIFIARYAP